MRNKDDDRLRLRLENKLSNQGLRAPCRLSVDVYHGTITLTGMVQYEYQKRSAIQAARTMDGVSGVIDRIKVDAPTRRWDDAESAGTVEEQREAIDRILHGTEPTPESTSEDAN